MYTDRKLAKEYAKPASSYSRTDVVIPKDIAVAMGNSAYNEAITDVMNTLLITDAEALKKMKKLKRR